ncbi:MAG TPA: hypothetical protein VHI13_04135 [Candidatus Kapabacteria bacterium]|nr:hypothetical protein [Candidatus Kapabacteria bacterium]
MIRDAHGASAPDHVARCLRHLYLEPIEEDAAEIAGLIGGLVATARERILRADIEPLHNEKAVRPRLPKRERECISNLAMLLAMHSMALTVAERPEEALAAGHEGVAWSRTANDLEQQAILWQTIVAALDRTGRFEESDAAVRMHIQIAHASKSPGQIVLALSHQVGDMLRSWQADEAERINDQVLAIIQNDLPEEARHPHYAAALAHRARIAVMRDHLSEALQGLREALRWADGDRFAVTRCIILNHLGVLYMDLAQYRQCIECQHEMVQLAEALRSSMIKGWGCLRLAQANIWLKEYDRAIELLDQAHECSPNGPPDLLISVAQKRAEVQLVRNNPEEAERICLEIVRDVKDTPLKVRAISAVLMLGRIDEECNRLERASERYREAIALAMREMPQRVTAAQLALAGVLYKLEQYDEMAALLNDVTSTVGLHPSFEAKALRLRAALAESRGDLRAVIDFERKAVAIEQQLLERQADQSLRNARVIAQTDLLEREAELERERRRRVERELADVVVALSDRKRRAVAVEKHLRSVLSQSTSQPERVVTKALHDAIGSLRSDREPHETLHHHLSVVDEEFYVRLRQRFPGLTRKQERLCGLIRSGLSSREVGLVLGLEPEGLKALRKRLRKRLGMEQEERLEAMLAGL